MAKTMTSQDVIDAIRRAHLRGEIDRVPPSHQIWSHASVDPGGAIWGEGPYVHLPLWDGRTIRVHAPARLRRKLAARWRRPVPIVFCDRCKRAVSAGRR